MIHIFDAALWGSGTMWTHKKFQKVSSMWYNTILRTFNRCLESKNKVEVYNAIGNCIAISKCIFSSSACGRERAKIAHIEHDLSFFYFYLFG